MSAKDIKARFHPVLKFYTRRDTVTFGRMLKAKGIRSYSHRGKTGYDLYCLMQSDSSVVGTICVGTTCEVRNTLGRSEREDVLSTPVYRTFEEAWAFAKGFAQALPDLDIVYGVIFEGDERVWDDNGFGDNCYATMISRGHPQPAHGGRLGS